jgi:hypothetical protein
VEHQWRDAELRTEAGGGEQAQRTRARYASCDQRGENEHPRSGEHRQREPELASDRGVGEQQEQHRSCERVRRVDPASECPGEQHERRHDARAQDGGLRADEEREPAHHGQPNPPPASSTNPDDLSHSQDTREDKRDV